MVVIRKAIRCFSPFNRTFKELKFPWINKVFNMPMPFNRTFKELKFHRRLARRDWLTLLIAPLRN